MDRHWSGRVTGPWFAWSVRAWGAFEREVVSGYYTDYVGAWAALISVNPIHLVGLNLGFLFANTSTDSLSGLITWLTSAGIPATALAFALGLLTWSTAALHAARVRVLPPCLLAYALVITAWPWPPSRFLVLLWPFILVYLTIGVQDSIGRLIPQKTAARLAVAGCAVAVVANLVLVVRVSVAIQRYGYPLTRPVGLDFSWTSFDAPFSVDKNTQ